MDYLLRRLLPRARAEEKAPSESAGAQSFPLPAGLPSASGLPAAMLGRPSTAQSRPGAQLPGLQPGIMGAIPGAQRTAPARARPFPGTYDYALADVNSIIDIPVLGRGCRIDVGRELSSNCVVSLRCVPRRVCWARQTPR